MKIFEPIWDDFLSWSNKQIHSGFSKKYTMSITNTFITQAELTKKLSQRKIYLKKTRGISKGERVTHTIQWGIIFLKYGRTIKNDKWGKERKGRGQIWRTFLLLLLWLHDALSASISLRAPIITEFSRHRHHIKCPLDIDKIKTRLFTFILYQFQ